jgi:O-antigen/teichoic acid export membrane protein
MVNSEESKNNPIGIDETSNSYFVSSITDGNGNREKADELGQLSKQIAKGSGIYVIGNILGKGLEILLHIMLTRFLGASAYGLYTLGISTMGLGQSIAALGVGNGIVRFGALYRGEGDVASIKGTFLSAIGISFVSSIIIAVVLYIGAIPLAVDVFHEPALVGVLRILAFALPFTIFVSLTASAARSFRRMNYMVGIETLTPSVTRLAIIAMFFIAGYRLKGVIYGVLASTIISSFFGGYSLIKIFPDIISAIKPRYPLRQLICYSLPTLLIGFSYLIVNRTDRLMLGYFKTSDAVGIYNAAAAIAILSLLVHNALVAIFGPMISTLHHKNKMNELRILYKRVAKWDFSLTLFIFLILSIFPNIILSLFGPEFMGGRTVLIALSLGFLISTIPGTTGLLLQMSGRQKLDLINSVCLIVLNIILNLWLIPIFGVLGAAIATLTSLAALNVIQAFEINMLYHFIPFTKAHLRSLIVGVIAAIVIFFPAKIVEGNLVYTLTLLIIFSSLYLVLSFAIVMDDEERFLIPFAIRKFTWKG